MSVTCYNVTKSSRAAVQAYSEGSCNHRTASPRRPAPRRSTTTNKPPSPSELFRTWPSIFFFCLFYILSFVFVFLSTHVERSITESMPMSRLWPRNFAMRPMMFAFVASESRLSRTFRRILEKQRQGVDPISTVYFFFLFFFFFLSTLRIVLLYMFFKLFVLFSFSVVIRRALS